MNQTSEGCYVFNSTEMENGIQKEMWIRVRKRIGPILVDMKRFLQRVIVSRKSKMIFLILL